jgi:hypothetical protein
MLQQLKPFYSFNPTFQNYNYIPFFQNNMSFNGANNYMAQMIGQHPPFHTTHTIPNNYGYYPNYPFVTSMPTPSAGMMGIQEAPKTTYPYMLNGAAGKQPQFIPIVSPTPIQMPGSSSIDQRMMLANPTLNPLMFGQSQTSPA